MLDSFLTWLDQASVDDRVEAIDVTIEALFHSDIESPQRDAYEAALTLFLDDKDLEVRKKLSSELATIKNVPHHIILTLAHDQIDVARPILLWSDILQDADLINIIITTSNQEQEYIAQRNNLTDTVKDVLIQNGSLLSIIELCKNFTIDLNNQQILIILKRYSSSKEIRKIISSRDNLPVEVTASFIINEEYIQPEDNATKSNLSSKQLTELIQDMREKALVNLIHTLKDDEIKSLVRYLLLEKHLTSSLLLRTLCMGQLRFFEETLIELSTLKPKRIFAILQELRISSLKALCLDAGLPLRTVPVIQEALKVHKQLKTNEALENPYYYSRHMINTIVDQASRNNLIIKDQELLAMLRKFSADAVREATRKLINGKQLLRIAA